MYRKLTVTILVGNITELYREAPNITNRLIGGNQSPPGQLPYVPRFQFLRDALKCIVAWRNVSHRAKHCEDIVCVWNAVVAVRISVSCLRSCGHSTDRQTLCPRFKFLLLVHKKGSRQLSAQNSAITVCYQSSLCSPWRKNLIIVHIFYCATSRKFAGSIPKAIAAIFL